MPKKVPADEASNAWVEEQWQRWDQARGRPQSRTAEEAGTFSPEAEWQRRAAEAITAASAEVQPPPQPKRSHNKISDGGAARQPFDDPDKMTLQEATAFWKHLTNTALSKPGAWEPQQYISIIAGRPTVAIHEIFAPPEKDYRAHSACDFSLPLCFLEWISARLCGFLHRVVPAVAG